MKIENFKVAHIYALTLFKYATQEKSLDKVYDDALKLKALLENNKNLAYFFINKLIKANDKIKTVEALQVQLKLDKTSLSFLKLLCKKRREYLLSEVMEQWIQLYYKHNNTANVIVTSAQKLTLKDITAIEKIVKTKLKAKNIMLQNIINTDIIGGIVVEYDDHILDLSIQHSLQQIQQQLLAH